MDPVWPFIVFINDTTVEVCRSIKGARRDYEVVDVENFSFEFYDFHGRPLKPVFPNSKSSSIFRRIFPKHEWFEFEIDPVPLLRPIDVPLLKTDFLAPADEFGSLDDLFNHLEENGCDLTHSRRRRDEDGEKTAD